MTDESAQPQGESKPENWAEGARDLHKNQLQALLKEYELSCNYVTHLEPQAWQMVAAVPIAAVAGVLYLISKLPPNGWGVTVFGIATCVVVLLLQFWYNAQERWRDFMRVHNYRRHEIEGCLGIYANRYVDWVDHMWNCEECKLSESVKNDPRFKDLKKEFAKTPKERRRARENDKFHPGAGHTSRRWIIRITGAAWIIALLGFCTNACLDP